MIEALLPWVWTIPFGIALWWGNKEAHVHGGDAEQHTMLVLIFVWIGTLVVSVRVESFYPALWYIGLDVSLASYLLWDQRANWQHIVIGLFAAMLLLHTTYVFGVGGGFFTDNVFLAKSILAVLAYLQIFVVVGSGRKWAGKLNARFSGVADWWVGTDWVLSRRHISNSRAGP